MQKQDITDRSNVELSLIVMNDEDLYFLRKSKGFLKLIDRLFIYNKEQLFILKQDIETN